MKGYIFFSNCVGWEPSDVHADGGLCDLIEQRHQITRCTLLSHVELEHLREIELELGYVAHHALGLTMAGDFHVEYFRSKHHGETVYGFRHSAIEYVFKA